MQIQLVGFEGVVVNFHFVYCEQLSNYCSVAAGEAAPWKKSQISIFIFLYSLEASSYLDLKETFIFLQ